MDLKKYVKDNTKNNQGTKKSPVTVVITETNAKKYHKLKARGLNFSKLVTDFIEHETTEKIKNTWPKSEGLPQSMGRLVTSLSLKNDHIKALKDTSNISLMVNYIIESL